MMSGHFCKSSRVLYVYYLCDKTKKMRHRASSTLLKNKTRFASVVSWSNNVSSVRDVSFRLSSFVLLQFPNKIRKR